MGNPLQEHLFSDLSVAPSPYARSQIVSENRPIQLLNAQIDGTMERSLQSEITQCPSINFSSSTSHALQNAQFLFYDLYNMTEDCQDLVYLHDDGWILGPNKNLLLWIPSSYQSSFHYTPSTRLVIPKGVPELDLSRMAHGSAWYRCYLPTTSQ